VQELCILGSCSPSVNTSAPMLRERAGMAARK